MSITTAIIIYVAGIAAAALLRSGLFIGEFQTRLRRD